ASSLDSACRCNTLATARGTDTNNFSSGTIQSCSRQSWRIGLTGNNSIYINVSWRDVGNFGLPIHPADLAWSAQELSPRYRHCYLAWNLPNTRPPSLEAGGM